MTLPQRDNVESLQEAFPEIPTYGPYRVNGKSPTLGGLRDTGIKMPMAPTLIAIDCRNSVCMFNIFAYMMVQSLTCEITFEAMLQVTKTTRREIPPPFASCLWV